RDEISSSSPMACAFDIKSLGKVRSSSSSMAWAGRWKVGNERVLFEYCRPTFGSSPWTCADMGGPESRMNPHHTVQHWLQMLFAYCSISARQKRMSSVIRSV